MATTPSSAHLYRYNWGSMSADNSKYVDKDEKDDFQRTTSPRSVAVIPNVISFPSRSDDGKGEEEVKSISNPHARLHWNMDPEVSFSDWIIDITYPVETAEGETAQKTKTYHVHKSVVAVGARRSEYLARMFLQQTAAGKNNNTTTIHLECLAAKQVFPIVLDYWYNGPDRPLSITTEAAPSLYHLGQRLEIPPLMEEVQHFWECDLTVDNLATYYQQAVLYGNDVLMEHVIDRCAKDISQVSPEYSEIVKVSSPTFWLSVLKKYNKDWPDYQSLHVSKIISKFCQTYPFLTASLFNDLVDSDNLPCISPEVALDFLALERNFFPHATEVVLELSDLQLRCIESLAFSWPCVPIQDDATKQILQQLSPLLLTELYTRSMARAQVTNTLLQNQVTSLNGAKEMLEDKNARLKRKVVGNNTTKRKNTSSQQILEATTVTSNTSSTVRKVEFIPTFRKEEFTFDEWKETY